MAIEFLRLFLQQATATGTKSTVLTDLRWFAGLLFSAWLVALKLNAPFWILVFIAIFLGLDCVIYLTAYIYFGIRSPDALRSEKFTLTKMAIEKSITGDNLSGLIDPENPKQPAQLAPSATEKGDL